MNFSILLLLSSFLGISNAFMAPECLDRYTTFYNEAYDTPSNETIISYNDIEANVCGSNCYNISECTSFTYLPSTWFQHAKCVLTSMPYKNVVLESSFKSAYYLKSQSKCHVYQNYHSLFILLFVVVVSLLLVCGCYNLGTKRQQRSDGYIPINS